MHKIEIKKKWIEKNNLAVKNIFKEKILWKAIVKKT